MKICCLLFLLATIARISYAQSSFDFSTVKDNPVAARVKAAPGFTPSPISFKDITKIGLIGIGNLNTESFEELNSAGKLSGYIRPVRKDGTFWTLNFAYNVNASNTDSLLAATFLFPDVGKNSFYISTDYSWALVRDVNDAHLVAPFFEFSLKNIKSEKKEQERYFNTLSSVLGLRYQYFLREGNDDFSFTTAVFFSSISVPDEDLKDYRFLFAGDENAIIQPRIHSIGFKSTFQVNRFQIFADLRHVFGKEEKIALRELRGFNSNIGVVFNATIFEK